MVNFFAPETNNRAPRREAERLKTMAESLREGGKSRGNEMVSGIVVKQSPLEHLARGLQTAAGGYFEGQATNKIDEDERALQQRMSEALSQWGNPQEAAAILAQDPRTAEMAFKLMQGETDFARQKELAQMRISALGGRGGNVPAPMQIANQMFELEQMMNNPNLPEEQRFLAERQYNLLGQAAKTYGFDRGLQAGGMAGYDAVFGTPQMQPNGTQIPQSYMPSTQDMQNIPPVNMMPNGEMQAPSMGGQIPSGPLNPMQFQELGQQQQFDNLIGGLTGQQQDPMAAHAAAVQAQQQQIGVSPMQRPDLRGVGMQEVPGYGRAVAGIAAQKKAAEEQAKTLNSPMDASIIKEQNEIVDKINTSQGLEASMNKFVGQIDGGQLDLGIMANLENMARNNVGMSTEQSRNLQSFKATLERLRNESLRLNTGVQTDGDAQRAWNELIANINDPLTVRQRLTEIAEINRIGSQLQNQKLNIMRSEYGRGELQLPNLYGNQQTQAQQPAQDINAEIEALERELGLR